MMNLQMSEQSTSNIKKILEGAARELMIEMNVSNIDKAEFTIAIQWPFAPSGVEISYIALRSEQSSTSWKPKIEGSANT